MAGHDTAPKDLGIDPAKGPQQLTRWLLASILLGRNVQQTIAVHAYEAFVEQGFTSPAEFADADHAAITRVLDGAGYTRYDDQIADELHTVMTGVRDDWDSVHRLLATAEDRDEARDRLTAYKGVGEVTARIFLDAVPADVYGSAG